MTTGTAALCLGPSGRGGFMVRQFTRRRPAADEIEVAVAAASVNPIDVRRSEGYGRRLLSLLGAGRFPLVLGNDLAGIVTAVGSGVSTFKVGDRVYGVKPASAEGTHASHVLVKANHVLPAPGRPRPSCARCNSLQLRDNVARRARSGAYPGKRLRKESAGPRRRRRARDAGDADAVRMGRKGYGDRPALVQSRRASRRVPPRWSTGQTSRSPPWRALSTQRSTSLPGTMISHCSAACATVRSVMQRPSIPMLGNFDRLGWVRGALKTISTKETSPARAAEGHQAITHGSLFRPDKAALAELGQFVEQNRVSLPIGLRKPLPEAAEAFDHVRKGQPGRALLVP